MELKVAELQILVAFRKKMSHQMEKKENASEQKNVAHKNICKHLPHGTKLTEPVQSELVEKYSKNKAV